MAKVRVVAVGGARTKITEWTSGTGQADEIVYDPTVLEARDIQMWAFNQGVLVDIQEEVGPFKKIVFVAVMV
jgi:hypothetical protein